MICSIVLIVDTHSCRHRIIIIKSVVVIKGLSKPGIDIVESRLPSVPPERLLCIRKWLERRVKCCVLVFQGERCEER